MFKIQLARQGQTMEQGTIVRWVKQEGDDLEIGDELFEVESEKAIIAIDVTRPGRLLTIVAKEGDIVPVGALLAIAADPGEQVSEAQIATMLQSEDAADVDSATRALTTPIEEIAEPALTAKGKVAIVPKARALAGELGIDIAGLKGTGPGGAILPGDVRRAATARDTSTQAIPKAADGKGATRRVPLSPIGRSMVASLGRSWQVPQFTQGVLVDASALVRAKQNVGDDRLSYMDLFLDAIVRAAQVVPNVLARLVDRDIEYQDAIDISIATSTDQGLLIPVLRNAGALSTSERGKAWRSLIECAREGQLSPDQVSGGILSLSNLGTRGVDYGTPLLPLGHSAIAFIGSLEMRPMVVDGRLEARHSVHVAITYDHRVVDGVLGSRFTSAVREALLAPLA